MRRIAVAAVAEAAPAPALRGAAPWTAAINALRIGALGGDEVLVAVDDDGDVHVFFTLDLDRPPLLLHNDFSTWGCATFGPRGLLAVSSNAHSVRIWDLPPGGPSPPAPRTLVGHAHNIPCIDFSPDGSKLIACSIDETCRIWDVATGALVVERPIGSAWNWTCLAIDTNDVVTVDALDPLWSEPPGVSFNPFASRNPSFNEALPFLNRLYQLIMGSRPGPHIHPQPAAPANPQAQDAPTVPPPRAAGLPEAARVSNDSDADSTGLLDEPASDDDSALLAARRSIEPTRPSLSSLATSAISDFRGLPTGAIQAIAAAQAQQTLGQLIGALETMPAENLVLGDLPHQPLSAPQVGADAGPLSIDISDSSPSSDMPDDDVDYDGHLDDADVHAGAFDFFYSGPLNGEDTSDNLLADDASDDASQDVFHDAEDTNDGDDEWDTTSIESDDVNHNIVAHMNPSAPAESSQETPSVVQEPSHIAAASQATTQPLSSPPIDDPAAHPAFAPSIDALDFVVSTTSAPDSPPQPPPAFHKRRKFTSQASLAGDGDEDAGHDASGAGASADAAAPPPPPPSFLILHTTVDDLFLLNGDTLETECRIAKILSGWDMRREYRGLERLSMTQWIPELSLAVVASQRGKLALVRIIKSNGSDGKPIRFTMRLEAWLPVNAASSAPLLGMTVTRHVSQVHPSLTYFRLITVTYTPEIFVYEIREQPSDLCVTAALL